MNLNSSVHRGFIFLLNDYMYITRVSRFTFYNVLSIASQLKVAYRELPDSVSNVCMYLCFVSGTHSLHTIEEFGDIVILLRT